MSTRAGTESVAHALQACTALQDDTTILSIDGISAFDSISRSAMLEGLNSLPEARASLKYVRFFYGRESENLWNDDKLDRLKNLTQPGGWKQAFESGGINTSNFTPHFIINMERWIPGLQEADLYGNYSCNKQAVRREMEEESPAMAVKRNHART